MEEVLGLVWWGRGWLDGGRVKECLERVFGGEVLVEAVSLSKSLDWRELVCELPYGRKTMGRVRRKKFDNKVE